MQLFPQHMPPRPDMASHRQSPALGMALRIRSEQGIEQAERYLAAMEPYLAPAERGYIARQLGVRLQPRSEPAGSAEHMYSPGPVWAQDASERGRMNAEAEGFAPQNPFLEPDIGGRAPFVSPVAGPPAPLNNANPFAAGGNNPMMGQLMQMLGGMNGGLGGAGNGLGQMGQLAPLMQMLGGANHGGGQMGSLMQMLNMMSMMGGFPGAKGKK